MLLVKYRKKFILISLLTIFIICSSISLPLPKSVSLQSLCPEGMAWIEGGTFRMGSDDFYLEERAVDDVTVDGFCMDRTEVTNSQFNKFVQATSYVTVAERPLSREQFPDLSDEMRKPGSLVFQMPETEVKKLGYLSWWHWILGANWQHPLGPDSDLQGKENYPVVHIAYEDAQAYAKWVKKSLPTEAQWEFAAKGGFKNAIFSWGNKYSAKKANTWQGHFPFANTQEDGFLGAAPVGSFPPNSYGLYDITGNVWEWTSDWYRLGHQGLENTTNPLGPKERESFDPQEPGVAKHVLKGGSYLCAKNYCSRYRPAARSAQSPDTGTTHIGFRLVTNKLRR